MKRSLILISILAFAMLPNSRAEPFSARCSELDRCIKAVSDLTGDKYIFSSDVSGKIKSSDNLELNRDNATLLLTKALHMNGYARIALANANTYEVVRARDARDSLLAKFTASAESAPKWPLTWDLAQLTYKAKHPEAVELLQRIVRNFLPATARVVPVELSGVLIVTASIPDLQNVYEMLRDADVKPTAELLKKVKTAN